MTQIEALRLQMPDVQNDELLQLMLDDAQTWILAQTGRTAMIAELYPVQRRLAAALYNKLGAEGQNSQSDGGISHNYDNELTEIMKEINRYRIANTLK